MTHPVRPSRRLALQGSAVLFALASLEGGRALAVPQTDDVAEARIRCERVAARFYARLGDLGVEVRSAPRIEIAYTPARTSFDPQTRVIFAPAWSQAPEALKGQVTAWAAATDGAFDARSLFAEIYNGFMIAHEACHAFQSDLGFWRPAADQYESEMVANRGATAFALETQGGRVALERIVRAAEAVLRKTPRPIPEGADERAFFNTDPDGVRADFRIIGWFEARMLVRAWATRNELDFPTMVRRLSLAADARV